MDQPGTGTASEITRTVNGKITRQNNATVYAPGQIVGGATAALSQIPFVLARTGGGSGKIRGIVAIDESNPGTAADLELWLFDTAPAAQVDAAAFNPSAAELEKCIGVIPIPVAGWRVASANGRVNTVTINGSFPYNCPTGAGSDAVVFGVLVARNAYTPTALSVILIRITVAQD